MQAMLVTMTYAGNITEITTVQTLFDGRKQK